MIRSAYVICLMIVLLSSADFCKSDLIENILNEDADSQEMVIFE